MPSVCWAGHSSSVVLAVVLCYRVHNCQASCLGPPLRQYPSGIHSVSIQYPLRHEVRVGNDCSMSICVQCRLLFLHFWAARAHCPHTHVTHRSHMHSHLDPLAWPLALFSGGYYGSLLYLSYLPKRSALKKVRAQKDIKFNIRSNHTSSPKTQP